MAYIIAHGTVNGYNKVYQPSNCGSELQVITDIRAEFDNTSTMLEKPTGYLIQMSSNGVWVSVVKLLFDGERSGNGPGFFAFSAFIPSQQVVDGGVLKHSLDKLMNDYLTQLSREYFTQNIGIDWSFVERASKELDTQCKHRTKTINTNYTLSDKFAFINIEKDEQVVKYLDKPFQPEYGAFRAVFFGTYLQNPNRQSTYTQLAIDLENEAYDVIWVGDTHDYPSIPKTVRKNQIIALSFCFSKKHYESRDILLSEGIVDDENSTVTVHVPQLDPVSYSLKFIINHPDAVNSITATSITSKIQIVSADNETLEFVGEQVDMQWRISIQTNENFLSKELVIVPSDYIDINSMNGEYGISLVELKLIKIQIFIDGYEDTKGQQQKIQIISRNTNTIEGGRYDKESRCLEFRIPILEDFDSLYNISLQDPFRNNYELLKESINEHHLVIIRINKRIVPSPTIRMEENNTKSNDYKTLKIFIPDNIAKEQIKYSYRKQYFCINNIVKSTTFQGHTVYTIQVPRELHRREILFYIDGKQLKSTNPQDDHLIITIQGFDSFWDALTYRLGKYKQLILISSIALLLVILLVCASIFTLDNLGYIEVKEWFGKNDTTTSANPNAVVGDHAPASYPTMSATYVELNQVLEDQKDAWNYDAIFNAVDKYAHTNAAADTLRRNDSAAYVVLKKLSWLYRTREMVNKRAFDKLPALVKVSNTNFETKWSMYIDNDKITFLRQLITPSNVNARIKFGDKIKADSTFINKKYSEIVAIWEACKQEAATPTIVKPKTSVTKPEHVVEQIDDPAMY